MSSLIPLVIGIVLTLIVVILRIVQAVYQDFVIAKLATSEEGGLQGDQNITQEKVVATLGVFRTTYDPSKLNTEQLEESELPVEKTEEDTIGFPLLFPVQSNFVSQILLFSEDFSSLGVLGDAANVLLGEPLQNLAALQFKSCDEYIQETNEALTDLFSGVNSLVQGLPQLIYGTAAEENNLINIINELSANLLNPLTAPVGAFYFGFLETAAEFAFASDSNCEDTYIALLNVAGNDTAKAELQFDNDDYFCLTNEFDEIDEFLQLSAITSAIFAICGDEDTPLSLGNCYLNEFSGAIAYIPEESIGDSVQFIGQDVCEIENICSDKLDYLSSFGNILVASGVESFISYGNSMQFLALLHIKFASRLQGNVDDSELVTTIISSLVEPLPDTFSDEYLPCVVVSIVAGVSTSECTYTKFLDIATDLAEEDENSLVELIYQASDLYSACARTGINTTECPRFFGSLFMNGTFQSPLGITELLTEEFEDDVTDKEILEQAQRIFSSGIALYCLGLTTGISGALFAAFIGPILFVSGLVLLFGGFLNFFALIVAKTAPIYQVVGDEEQNFNEVFYESGSVPVIALAAFVLSIFTMIVYFYAGHLAYITNSEESEAEVSKSITAENEKKDTV
eukprot:snap_masked-scaffold_6-processed-gene-9.1-mRNA-1 protein AED:1.00 eAED:1.00 QI:0/0/0/0/1/1/2/0/626